MYMIKSKVKITKKILTVIVFGIIVFSCASKMHIYNVGQLDDHKTNEEGYDEDANLFYSVTKDNHYLHLLIHTNQTSTKIKILTNGVKIFFDNSGDRNKDKFIQYPIKSDINKMSELRSFGDDKNKMISIQVFNLC